MRSFPQLAELASRREPDKIRLGPRPGGRVLSVVSAPKKKEGGSLEREVDDLEISERSTGGETLEGHSLVDLDESSDDELVVGPPATS